MSKSLSSRRLHELVDAHSKDKEVSLEELNNLINVLVLISIEKEFGGIEEFESYIEKVYGLDVAEEGRLE